MERAKGMEKEGLYYSYDMLGRSRPHESDAKRYHLEL